VLFLLSVVRRDVHLTLTLGNLAKANHTIDLRDDRRIARLAGLEQFDNSRQTAGDVLRTGGFARDLREDVAGVQFVSVLHHQVSAAGHQVTLVALGGLDDDGRLTLLVGGVGNHEARKAGDFVDFFVEREAFLQVLELDRTGDFREDRERVRVPLADHIAELDLCTVFDLQLRAVNDRVALLLAALRIDDGDGAVAVHRNQAAVVGTNGDEVDEVNLTRVLGFEVRSVLHARCGSADVEGTHGELRARLADGLRCDNADSLTHLNHLARAEVTAVAQDAAAALGFAGEHGANLYTLDTRCLNRGSLVFVDFLVDFDDGLTFVIL